MKLFQQTGLCPVDAAVTPKRKQGNHIPENVWNQKRDPASFDLRLPDIPVPFLKLMEKEVSGNEKEAGNGKAAYAFGGKKAYAPERLGRRVEQRFAMVQEHDRDRHRETKPVYGFGL